jgi:hypothetical protein
MPMPPQLQNALNRRMNGGKGTNPKKTRKLAQRLQAGLPSANNPNTNKTKVSTFGTPGFKNTSNEELAKKAAIQRRLTKK